MKKSMNISHPTLYVTMVYDYLNRRVQGHPITFECIPNKHLTCETSWFVSQHDKVLLFSTGIIFVCKVPDTQTKK